MNSIVIIVLAFSLLLVAFLLFERTEAGILLSVNNIIICGAALLWSVIFPIIYFYSLTNKNNEYLAIISEYDAFDMFRYYICVVVFLFFFVKTFRLVSNKQHLYTFFMIEDGTKITDRKKDQLFIATVLLFAIGILSDFLYCRAYGGYFGYLEYSSYIRSGITNIINNRWSFLIVFRDCVIISSYLFYSQLRKKNSINRGRVILFVISFIYSLAILYANRGRLSFFIYIAVYGVTFLLEKKEIKFIKANSLLFMMMVFLIFIEGFSWISGLVGRTSDFKPIDMLCNEIAFCFANFKLLLDEMNIDDVRMFIDIVSYPLFLLPSSLWRKILPDTPSDFMTILVSGNKKGQGGVYGETPIDAISIGYLQFGVIGVCVFAIFFGIIAAKLYNQISKISITKTRKVLLVNVMIDIFLRSLFYADSYNIVQRCFSLVVFALLYWGVGLFRKK